MAWDYVPDDPHDPTQKLRLHLSRINRRKDLNYIASCELIAAHGKSRKEEVHRYVRRELQARTEIANLADRNCPKSDEEPGSGSSGAVDHLASSGNNFVAISDAGAEQGPLARGDVPETPLARREKSRLRVWTLLLLIDDTFDDLGASSAWRLLWVVCGEEYLGAGLPLLWRRWRNRVETVAAGFDGGHAPLPLELQSELHGLDFRVEICFPSYDPSPPSDEDDGQQNYNAEYTRAAGSGVWTAPELTDLQARHLCFPAPPTDEDDEDSALENHLEQLEKEDLYAFLEPQPKDLGPSPDHLLALAKDYYEFEREFESFGGNAGSDYYLRLAFAQGREVEEERKIIPPHKLEPKPTPNSSFSMEDLRNFGFYEHPEDVQRRLAEEARAQRLKEQEEMVEKSLKQQLETEFERRKTAFAHLKTTTVSSRYSKVSGKSKQSRPKHRPVKPRELIAEQGVKVCTKSVKPDMVPQKYGKKYQKPAIWTVSVLVEHKGRKHYLKLKGPCEKLRFLVSANSSLVVEKEADEFFKCGMKNAGAPFAWFRGREGGAADEGPRREKKGKGAGASRAKKAAKKVDGAGALQLHDDELRLGGAKADDQPNGITSDDGSGSSADEGAAVEEEAGDADSFADDIDIANPEELFEEMEPLPDAVLSPDPEGAAELDLEDDGDVDMEDAESIERPRSGSAGSNFSESAHSAASSSSDKIAQKASSSVSAVAQEEAKPSAASTSTSSRAAKKQKLDTEADVAVQVKAGKSSSSTTSSDVVAAGHKNASGDIDEDVEEDAAPPPIKKYFPPLPPYRSFDFDLSDQVVPIFTPSARRPTKALLNYFGDHCFGSAAHLQVAHVVVVEPQDYDEYRKSFPEHVFLVLDADDCGIGYSRYIIQTFATGCMLQLSTSAQPAGSFSESERNLFSDTIYVPWSSHFAWLIDDLMCRFYKTERPILGYSLKGRMETTWRESLLKVQAHGSVEKTCLCGFLRDNGCAVGSHRKRNFREWNTDAFKMYKAVLLNIQQLQMNEIFYIPHMKLFEDISFLVKILNNPSARTLKCQSHFYWAFNMQAGGCEDNRDVEVDLMTRKRLIDDARYDELEDKDKAVIGMVLDWVRGHEDLFLSKKAEDDAVWAALKVKLNTLKGGDGFGA